MQVSKCVGCKKFPCADVKHNRYVVPDIEVRPEDISIIMISEAAPANRADYYYAKGDPLFQQTTSQAFKDAGVKVSSMEIQSIGRDFGFLFPTFGQQWQRMVLPKIVLRFEVTAQRAMI